MSSRTINNGPVCFDQLIFHHQHFRPTGDQSADKLHVPEGIKTNMYWGFADHFWPFCRIWRPNQFFSTCHLNDFSISTSISLLSYTTRERGGREEWIKIIGNSCLQRPLAQTYCTLEGVHVDWHEETTFIHHATLSHPATSDFKPSHPPTSSPKPLLSSAINHHLATGQQAQNKVTLHPATNTSGGGK